MTYDQRNAVVVGLAMGFAVIPIIFTIADDAFSSVPSNLTAGSLALGASRWQTAVRVVLPTASPGVFSAIMIGFGRAVGETMIVLMATGNTPVSLSAPGKMTARPSGTASRVTATCGLGDRTSRVHAISGAGSSEWIQ